jgi:hypothetical protein
MSEVPKRRLKLRKRAAHPAAFKSRLRLGKPAIGVVNGLLTVRQNDSQFNGFWPITTLDPDAPSASWTNERR